MICGLSSAAHKEGSFLTLVRGGRVGHRFTSGKSSENSHQLSE